ncbi:MAG: tripartite tricarboxylate transporter permease [Defluviitaleaceae bacterium]|nr:tripartite tricarboxylate transporter permease [Defluviitaleaceae bacterium]
MDWAGVISTIFTLENLLIMNVGVFAGIVIGVLPGLNAVFAVAIMLPFTFGMESVTGMYLMLGAYAGAVYGGSIPSILLNTPGNPANVMTVFDGFPMAQQGRAGDALKFALVGSVFGGLFSSFVLVVFAPILATVALLFGSPEFFALSILGMFAAIGLAGGNIVKGLIMAIAGMFVSTVGMDVIDGTQRFLFGSPHLLSGINVVAVMLGMFALSEAVVQSRQALNVQSGKHTQVVYQKSNLTLMYTLKNHWRTLLRSSGIGAVIGAIPGLSPSVSSIVSYDRAQRASKNPDEFGKGHPDGVIASETGNSATSSSTLIPLLTLGIPGDAASAVLLGALAMQNIIPGPDLFAGGSIWVFALMGGLFILNLFIYVQGGAFVKLMANVIKVPVVILLPCIIMLATVGAFAIANTTFNTGLILIFAAFGYFIKVNKFPFPPFVIALVLGEFFETNLRRSLILSGGSYSIFFTRPISAAIILLSVVSLLYPLIKAALKNRKTIS